MATEGLASTYVSLVCNPWPDEPPERVWIFERKAGRLPILIGQDW